MCASCCSEPGWLVPADWEKIAKRLEISKEELLNRYLVIDYLADGRGYHYVLAPVKVVDGEPLVKPGERVPWVYAHMLGSCIFLKDNLCSLHPVKPLECTEYECTSTNSTNNHSLDPNQYAQEILQTSKRKEILKMWEKESIEGIDLKDYVAKRFDLAHCKRNLEIEQLLLKEYQEDFPDYEKIRELEQKLE